MIMPNTLSLIRVIFTDGKERATALGIWAAVSGLGAAVGPLVGGLLLEYFSWHAAFLVNVPLMVGAIIAGIVFLPESRVTSPGRWDALAALLSLMGRARGAALVHRNDSAGLGNQAVRQGGKLRSSRSVDRGRDRHNCADVVRNSLREKRRSPARPAPLSQQAVLGRNHRRVWHDILDDCRATACRAVAAACRRRYSDRSRNSHDAAGHHRRYRLDAGSRGLAIHRRTGSTRRWAWPRGHRHALPRRRRLRSGTSPESSSRRASSAPAPDRSQSPPR